jgi:hypothetical protein
MGFSDANCGNIFFFNHHPIFLPTCEPPRTTFSEALIQLSMDCHGSEYSAKMKGRTGFSRLKDLRAHWSFLFFLTGFLIPTMVVSQEIRFDHLSVKRADPFRFIIPFWKNKFQIAFFSITQINCILLTLLSQYIVNNT